MHRLTRRDLLGRLGIGGALALAQTGCDSPTGTDLDTSLATAGGTADVTTASTSTPSCLVSPQQTEGPYYFDARRVRRDITEGRSGVPLDLSLTVVQAGDCAPVRDAVVDIWHCDAEGSYSGYASEGTAGQDFLRGIQVTDSIGEVRFSTIYPGWYAGRTIHIHAKVHLDDQTVLTTQLYFPESASDAVMAMSPYNRRGNRTTRNSSDGIFSSETVLVMSGTDDGWSAALVVGVSS